MSLAVDSVAVWSSEQRLVGPLSLTIASGSVVALVGESGSGKSLFARALVGLLPSPLRRTGRVEAASMVYVPQDTGAALHPTRTVGSLFREMGCCPTQALGWLDSLQVPASQQVLSAPGAFLSGGVRQRVTLALGLAAKPGVVLADEPTGALDVSSKGVVRRVLRQVANDGVAVMLITHDLALLAHEVDRFAVLYRGLLVEEGPIQQLQRPRHPYTEALVARSLPNPGTPATSACVFSAECRWVSAQCSLQPALSDGVACYHPRPS